MTIIAAVVAPVLQEYVPPPEAVSVAVAPTHIIPSSSEMPELSATLIAGTGAEMTMTLMEAWLVQPLSPMISTRYWPLSPGSGLGITGF